MTGRSWASAGFVVASLLIAGCAAGGGSSTEGDAMQAGGPDDSTDPSPHPTVEAGAAVGAVRGHVVDDELRPVANATVRIAELDVAAVTGPDGRYGLARLAPGTYRVEATKEHYAGLGQDVTIEAGLVTQQDFTITVLAADGPYVAVYPRTGYLDISQGSLDQLILRQLNQTCFECKLVVHLDEEPLQYLHEFSFQPTYSLAPASEPALCWHLHRNTTEDYSLLTPGHIFSGCTPDGGRQLFDHSRIAAWDRQFTLYLSGRDASAVALDQSVEVWFSIAHGQALPTGWSALPPEGG